VKQTIRHKTERGKPKRSRNLWANVPNANRSEKERGKAIQAFHRAAWWLATTWRAPDDWTDAERLALRLAGQVGEAFLYAPGPGNATIFRRALRAFDMFDRSGSLQRKRLICVSAAATYAEQWRQAAHAAEKKAIAERLIYVLTLQDEAFAQLERRRTVAHELASWDASAAGTAGRHGGEFVLAALMVEGEIDALGIDVNARAEPEEELERIRAKLANSASRVLARDEEP